MVEDIGDWQERFRARAEKGWRRDGTAVPRKPLKGGVSLKIQKAIDWHGEDWCGIRPPKT